MYVFTTNKSITAEQRDYIEHQFELARKSNKALILTDGMDLKWLPDEPNSKAFEDAVRKVIEDWATPCGPSDTDSDNQSY